jgi:CyaY protein
MTALTDQQFRLESDKALEDARRALLPLSDREGFEVELENGVLNVMFEKPAETKFVVSPYAPQRQVWVAAMAKSYKLAWAPEVGGFAIDGETLPHLLERLTRDFLDRP